MKVVKNIGTFCQRARLYCKRLKVTRLYGKCFKGTSLYGKHLKVTRLYCKHLKVNLKFIFEDYLPEGPIEAFDDWEEDYDQFDDFLENDNPLAAERWDMS